MKISYRIILINFSIVALILLGAGFTFYSIMFNVLTSQQSKLVLNSASDFLFTFQSYSQQTEESFQIFLKNVKDKKLNSYNLSESKYLDFVFKMNQDSVIEPDNIAFSKSRINILGITTFDEFQKANPYIILKNYRKSKIEEFFYGIVLTKEYLNSISQRTKSDIAVFINNKFAEYSNEDNNRIYFSYINKSFNNLIKKNNFDIYSEETDNSYFLATIFNFQEQLFTSKKISVIIFSNLSEPIALKKNLQIILSLLGISGILVSLILTLLFTSKIRKRINKLTEATDITKQGNFKTRLYAEGNDELGELALAFNKMLDELEKQEQAKNDYTDFITLVNQNPSLNEISESALSKIINTACFNVGAIYIVEGDNISLTASYGIGKDFIKNTKDDELLSLTIKKAEKIEIKFDDNAPKIYTGTINFQIRYLLIIPIIYRSKVIAVLELGAVNVPKKDSLDYLDKIRDQLAIGITNATAYLKLENLVNELKFLNEDYSKQNLQIKEQNEKLIELHNKLIVKAEELEIQKKKAEESTSLKSRFLALISHELRTPLNAILGLTELVLEDSTINNRAKERLNVVMRSSNRLLSLINDILDFSKIEAGKMEIRYEKFLLNELIDEINLFAVPLIQEKNLSFKINCLSPTKILVGTDRSKLFQILVNLIGNAIKFTNIGKVELKVNLIENKNLIFDVIDTGLGISEEDQKIIFEEFRQADSSGYGKFSGTGLGLTISKRYSELLNGSLSLVSNKNTGSTFTLNIPIDFYEKFVPDKLDLETENLSSSQTDNISNYAFTDSSIDGFIKIPILKSDEIKEVLIVDDDPDSLYTLNEILQQFNFSTQLAKNGKECLEILEMSLPDLILLDIMMPVMDGFTTIKKIKENSRTQGIPVIAITAKAMLEDTKIIYKYGFDGYIAKPINSNILSARIHEVLIEFKKLSKAN